MTASVHAIGATIALACPVSIEFFESTTRAIEDLNLSYYLAFGSFNSLTAHSNISTNILRALSTAAVKTLASAMQERLLER
jgi:hypothetical protein